MLYVNIKNIYEYTWIYTIPYVFIEYFLVLVFIKYIMVRTRANTKGQHQNRARQGHQSLPPTSPSLLDGQGSHRGNPTSCTPSCHHQLVGLDDPGVARVLVCWLRVDP